MKLISISVALGIISFASKALSNDFETDSRVLTLEEINDQNAVLKFPVYDNAGRLIDTKDVKAKSIWPKMDNWTSNVTDKYENEKGSPKVQTQWVWDNELKDNIEDLRIPQDIDQWKKLEKQEDAATKWKPSKVVEPQKLASSLSRVFGDNSTFGIFQNGDFSTEGETEQVKVSQSFSAGGSVFGKRITLVSQSTKSDSKSKVTTSNVKVLDSSVFVSNDGTVFGNKSFTRSKEISKVFVLGVLPVRVAGKISGSMGANFNYNANGLSIKGSVAPFVNTRGTASAGIDLLLVVAGIEGSLTFLNNTLVADFNASVDPFAGELQTALKVQNNLNLLSGKISVFAKIRRLFRRDKKFSKTIFSFNGIVQNTTLIDESIKAEL